MHHRLLTQLSFVLVVTLCSRATAFVISDPPKKWGDSELGTGATIEYSFSLGTEEITEGGNPVQTVPLDTIFPRGYELEVERALITWAAYSNLDFRRQVDGLYREAVDISFGAHPRGDDNYLAHAGLPPQGDVHFASDLPNPYSFVESDPGPHVLTLSVHELGHSLGLLHSQDENRGLSVMNGGGLTTDGFHETIWQDDIDAIQFLYGPASGATWDPGFDNLSGDWSMASRWFTNTEPDATTPASIFNGNISVTQLGEAASSLRLGGMSGGLVRMLGSGELLIAGETSIRDGGQLAMLGGSFSTASLDLSEGGMLTQRVGFSSMDVVEVSDVAMLSGGILNVSLTSGFELAAGDLSTILTYDTHVGQFKDVYVPINDPLLTYRLTYGDDSTDLFVYRPGDMDFDGELTAADWVQLSSHLYTSTADLLPNQAYSRGDLNFDGQADEFDFVLFKELFEAANGAGAFAALATRVPEPPTWMVALLVALVAVSRGKREQPSPKLVD